MAGKPLFWSCVFSYRNWLGWGTCRWIHHTNVCLDLVYLKLFRDTCSNYAVYDITTFRIMQDVLSSCNTYKQYGTQPERWHVTEATRQRYFFLGDIVFQGLSRQVKYFSRVEHVVDWICMYLTLANSDHQGSSFFLNVGDPYKHHHLPLAYWEAEHLDIQKYVYQVWIPKFTILVTLYIHYVHKHYINPSTSFFKDHFRTILVGKYKLISWSFPGSTLHKYTSLLRVYPHM